MQEKIAIYIRTSTTEQNPENQLKDCLSIKPDGEYAIFEDKQSAWKDKDRPQFNILYKLIKSRKVEHLIVWDIDRLYRNRTKLISFFEICKMHNCKIHSFRQKFFEDINNIPPPFDDIMHTLMLSIMGWLAEEESNKKSARVKAAVRKKNNVTVSHNGNKWGRKSISTFKKNIIRKLYAEGLSMRKIAAEVNLGTSTVHKFIQVIKGENASE